MTREEAIKELRRLHYAYKADEHGDYFYDNADDVCQAASVAISALREQEERSKGCKYCTATYIQHGSLVGFCPYCGRRLEEI